MPVRRISLGLAMVAVLLSPAAAADRAVRLAVPPDPARDLSALPPIADPADAAESAINAALRRLDAKVVKAASECRSRAGGQAWWERSVEAAMRGPRFLSFAVTDNTFCGGAHPNVGTWSIVYDLTRGTPVDWTSLLPPALTGTVALAEQADGTKVVTLASKRLHALYLERYRPKTGEAKTGETKTSETSETKAEDPDDACRQAVATFDGGPPAMMVWLDARERGLAVRFDLAHVVQACADTVVIPAPVLRAEGAEPVLVEAILAGRAIRD